MAGRKLPKTQVLLTNVAVVRLKKKGKRFEIACYKNKVLDWRNGIETDIDEVLQIERIFTNVTRGIEASTALLDKAFGGLSRDMIIREILFEGTMQIGRKERAHDMAKVKREIINYIKDECINTDTGLPFSFAMIESALKEITFNVSLQKPAKVQAVSFFKELRDKRILPISRAKMKIRMEIRGRDEMRRFEHDCYEWKQLVASKKVEVVSMNKVLSTVQCVALIEPGVYRTVRDLISAITKGSGTVELLELAVIEDLTTAAALAKASASSRVSEDCLPAVAFEPGATLPMTEDMGAVGIEQMSERKEGESAVQSPSDSSSAKKKRRRKTKKKRGKDGSPEGVSPMTASKGRKKYATPVTEMLSDLALLGESEKIDTEYDLRDAKRKRKKQAKRRRKMREPFAADEY